MLNNITGNIEYVDISCARVTELEVPTGDLVCARIPVKEACSPVSLYFGSQDDFKVWPSLVNPLPCHKNSEEWVKPKKIVVSTCCNTGSFFDEEYLYVSL